MKNFEKIHKLIVKEIKKELATCKKFKEQAKKEFDLNEYLEYKGNVSVLEWLLELIKEIDGTKWNNMIFHKEQWKKFCKGFKK